MYRLPEKYIGKDVEETDELIHIMSCYFLENTRNNI